MMRASDIVRVALMAMCATLLHIGQAAVAQTRANVVFILADNVGYGDLGPYGDGELRGAPTPRIGQLAREGLRLTQYLVKSSHVPMLSRPNEVLAAIRMAAAAVAAKRG